MSSNDEDTAITAEEADKLETPRNIQLQGDVTGTFSFDGSTDVNFTTSLSADSVESGHIGSNEILTSHIKSRNITNGLLANDNVRINAGSGLSGGGSVDLGSAITLTHDDTSSVNNSSNGTNAFIKNLTFDSYGHVATLESGTIDVTSFVNQANIDASVDALEAKLVAGAPNALNTLNEIATASN